MSRLAEVTEAELSRHEAPRFLDSDRVDRGALNCPCGTRLAPGPDSLRDWPGWRKHVAMAIALAILRMLEEL